VTGHLVNDVLEALVVNVQTVILDGSVSLVTAPCPSAAFMVEETQVSTDLATRFVDGSCADIGDGVRVHVTGVVAVGGMRALEVRLQEPVVSVRGNILDLTGACPAVGFAINSTPVATSTTTVFTGGACADLLEGVSVEATGRLVAGTLGAESITLDIAKTGQTQSSSIEGMLDSVSGLPPKLVLLVDGATVRTNANTRVMRRGDAQALVDLVAGQRVHVVGDRFPDGVIAARKIQIKADAASGRVVLEGKVSGLRGDCPTVTFVINGVQIVTNELTTFNGSPCATLQNGQRVTVSGLAQADGTVAAGTLDAEPSKRHDGDSDDDEEQDGNGSGQGKGKKPNGDDGDVDEDEDEDDSADDEEEEVEDGEGDESPKGNGKGKGRGRNPDGDDEDEGGDEDDEDEEEEDADGGDDETPNGKGKGKGKGKKK
ncbi:MAG: DUF5666 domain-containing protein, partial [Vicinamibacterales bacterium]|nr:DUF5666 domain-containing protein [Vicinamibacterales bacterium]